MLPGSENLRKTGHPPLFICAATERVANDLMMIGCDLSLSPKYPILGEMCAIDGNQFAVFRKQRTSGLPCANYLQGIDID
jgi:hypothetical protein